MQSQTDCQVFLQSQIEKVGVSVNNFFNCFSKAQDSMSARGL